MNALTQRLFAEGYTKDHHPPNVHWAYYREFAFNHDYLMTTVWETPCGLLEKGSRFSNGYTSYGGIDYRPENNNPLGGCPYMGERKCPHLLPKMFAGENCIYHYTRRPFDYELSCQKLWDAWDAMQHQAWRKVTDGYGPCSCVEWDQPSRSYVPRYHPQNCINSKCSNPVCAITKLPRNLEKVNIYYDLLRVSRYRIGFADYVDKTLEKGKKQFKHPVARTDAENWLKAYGNEKFRCRRTRKDRTDSHFSEWHGQDGFGEYEYFHFEVTPQNIRIIKRDSRDLTQDLRDVAEGIQVTHASDLKKEAAAAKRQRRDARKEAKARSAERKKISRLQQMLATGLMPDGHPCEEHMLEFCKQALSKLSVPRVPEEMTALEQISLWEADNG